jgi:hypothetical protein
VTDARQQATLRALKQAHRLMEAGQYARAYPVFKRLGDGAARREMSARAAHLYVQAAHARLEMGGGQDAAALAQHAIRLLAGAGRVDRAAVLLPRLIQSLKERGHYDLAVSLRAEIAALSGVKTRSVAEHQGTLPARCPSCHGPLRPDEVDWIDGQSAACASCGSAVRAG